MIAKDSVETILPATYLTLMAWPYENEERQDVKLSVWYVEFVGLRKMGHHAAVIQLQWNGESLGAAPSPRKP